MQARKSKIVRRVSFWCPRLMASAKQLSTPATCVMSMSSLRPMARILVRRRACGFVVEKRLYQLLADVLSPLQATFGCNGICFPYLLWLLPRIDHRERFALRCPCWLQNFEEALDFVVLNGDDSRREGLNLIRKLTRMGPAGLSTILSHAVVGGRVGTWMGHGYPMSR